MTDIMDQLLEDQRTAMKAKDETKLAAIRMIRSALQNAQTSTSLVVGEPPANESPDMYKARSKPKLF